jgi:hypothetical protein
LKRLALATAMAAVALPLTAVAVAAPAQAAPQPNRSVRVTPSPVILQAKSSTWVTVKTRVDGLPAGSWVNVELRGPGGDYNGEAVIEDSDGDGVFQTSLKFDRYNKPGAWRAETEIYNYDTGHTTEGPSTAFRVKRNTRLTANAKPEPVRKGRTLTVTGRLTQLTAYGIDGDYVGFRGQRVAVYFKKKGSAKWVFKGYAKTSAKGVYTKKFKAKADGSWQARFAGNGSYKNVISTADYVDVR